MSIASKADQLGEPEIPIHRTATPNLHALVTTSKRPFRF